MMRIAITYSPWLLSARGSLDLGADYREDPRGLSGSEMCFARLSEEFAGMGHEVMRFAKGQYVSDWDCRRDWDFDVALSINCPDDLRGMRAKVKVCYALLNDFTFAKVGFEEHVDLFVSPSAAHMTQCLTNPEWSVVERTPDHPNGKAQWDPKSKPWAVVPLGCDPERYDIPCGECGGTGVFVAEDNKNDVYNCLKCLGTKKVCKVPGRVVYTSSPDRGLHWLLQEWPAIRRAVPHATLRIFYRTRDWIRAFDGTAYYPPIEGQRARALYIEEALRRLEGHGVELIDAVSRAQLERELAQAEVLAFPCDPANNFTEGFSCATLEGCAARACPVITDADALGSIYGGVAVTTRMLKGTPFAKSWLEAWRGYVVAGLTDEEFRNSINDRAERFAKEHTWKATAAKLMAAIQERL